MEIEKEVEFTIPDGSGNPAAPVEDAVGDTTTPEVPEVEAAPETDGDETAAEPHADDAKKPPRGVQKRLDELTKEKYEWKREADYRRERELALQAKIDELERKTTGQTGETVPASDAKPNSDQFEDYDDYVEALTDWKTGQKIAKAREESAKIAAEQAKATSAQRVQQGFQEAVKVALSKHPDFDDVVRGSTAPITQAMDDAIKVSPDGPEVMYHLAKNPQEADRIARLSPLMQILEMGKLQAKVTQVPPKAPEPRRITNAGEPITTVSGAGVTEEDPQKMNMEDYAAWRMAGVR